MIRVSETGHEYIDEGEDETLDRIIEALERVPIPPAEPPPWEPRKSDRLSVEELQR